jgi:phage shock protein C
MSYCTHCGSPTGDQPRPFHPATPKLMRDMRSRKVAGVCAGLARYLGMDVALVRIVVLTLAICGGFGLVGYVIAWVAMPKDDAVAYLPPPLATAPSASS